MKPILLLAVGFIGHHAEPVTRQEMEQKMDELAREYHNTHDPEIPEQLLELGRQLREWDH